MLGVQFVVAGQICNGMLVAAVNLPPGQNSGGAVNPPLSQCNADHFIKTLNYKVLPNGKPGTHQYPPRPIDPNSKRLIMVMSDPHARYADSPLIEIIEEQ
jgi:hypothetical protein